MIDAFLQGTGWEAAQQQALAADASYRTYRRLQQGDETALLMVAPPAHEPKTPIFVTLSNWLCQAGLSAPRIIKSDLAQGLVLLEDFGVQSFSQVLEDAPEREAALYSLAGDVVCYLAGRALPDLPPYDEATMRTELSVFCDDWWPDAFGTEMPSDVRAAFDRAWDAPLALAEKARQTAPIVTLRDFHKDNLFFLPNRTGPAQVGLIDFQDALIGHAAYDVVSLLQDVRRDISDAVQNEVLNAVSKALGDPHFETGYAIYGAQRALKILGVFVRLDRRDGKPAYRVHLGRCWNRFLSNMDQPALASVKTWLDTHIPVQKRQTA